jgi:hypothetical protein
VDEIDVITARQIRAANAFMDRFAGALLGEAQRIVPLEEGTLGASGDIRVDHVPGGRDWIVYFSTPYAARQHEELEWHHMPGRQAKYLEEPAKRFAPVMAPGLAAAIERA